MIQNVPEGFPKPGTPGYLDAVKNLVEKQANVVVSYETEMQSAEAPEGPQVACRAEVLLPPNKKSARGVFALSVTAPNLEAAEELLAQQLFSAAFSSPQFKPNEAASLPKQEVSPVLLQVNFQAQREQVADQLLSYLQQLAPEVSCPPPGDYAKAQARTMGFNPNGSLPFLLKYLLVARDNNLIAAQVELICARLGTVTVPGYAEGDEGMRNDVREMLMGNVTRIEPLITFLNVALNGLKVPNP